MRATGTLLLMLIALIRGTVQTQSICGDKHSGRQGQTVHLKITKTGEDMLILKKSYTTIFRVRNSETTFSDLELEKRFTFVSATGTLTITSAQISDSGSYTTETFTTSGKSTGKCTFQLTIEAPVTIPVVTHSCGDDLKAWVTCSSSGTSPQYSWSLDGRPLSEADGDNIDKPSIKLKGDLAGKLKCTASNSVNSESKIYQLPGCHGKIASTPSLATVSPPLNVTVEDESEAWNTEQLLLYVVLPCSAVLGLLILVTVIVLVCMCRRKRKRKRRPHKAAGPIKYCECKAKQCNTPAL